MDRSGPHVRSDRLVRGQMRRALPPFPASRWFPVVLRQEDGLLIDAQPTDVLSNAKPSAIAALGEAASGQLLVRHRLTDRRHQIVTLEAPDETADTYNSDVVDLRMRLVRGPTRNDTWRVLELPPRIEQRVADQQEQIRFADPAITLSSFLHNYVALDLLPR
jgi:hypothetical protein